MDTISDKKISRLVSLKRNLLLFAGGAAGYYTLEILYRGYSHWSMALCGGLCMFFIYRMNSRLCRRRIFLRAVCGSLIITAVEMICGCVVNLAFKMNVWDYSELPLNLLGQICLPFSLLWFGLCIPVCGLCSAIRNRWSG
ncbi:MAG: hypothetical protein ACI3XQ_12690 [Eubacteriales bacterium]